MARKGVVRDHRTGFYYARIYYDKEQHYLGTFRTYEEAVKAREKAEKEYSKKEKGNGFQ